MRALHLDTTHHDQPILLPEQRLIMAIIGRGFMDLRVNGERVLARAYISSEQCDYHCNLAGIDVDKLRQAASRVKREKRKPGEHL